jgi:WD40 repeat protein
VGFDGFLSYSHAADGRLAPAVQRGLHSLARPWHRRRALWIFRDQTGLAVTPSLWSAIQDALNSSEYFVLMASPEAAQSSWVDKEIRHWLATKSPDRILPIVTDGEWLWDATRSDFSEDSTAVPDSLRGVFAEEPLYLDLRWARADGHLSLRHSRFRDAIAQLAAPMHGVSKDDLEGEDVRQHRRARRLWSVAVAGLAALTLVATMTGVLAVRNANQANASAAEASRQQKRAAEQEINADRSADEASVQLASARQHEERAKRAVEETRRQEKLAKEQRALADRASADAVRQQANARRQQANARVQQQAATKAAKRAQEQEALARQQSEAAKKSGEEAERQRKLAAEQAQLARDAKDEAERQKRAAALQAKLADEAAAEARRQQEVAREQQRLAEKAAAEAAQQKANAEQQQRIAIGRRLINDAHAITAVEPRTALMLGTAAVKVQAGDEARGQLASMVASTQFAGPLEGIVRDVGYLTDTVVVTQDSAYELRLWNVTDRANPVFLASLGRYQFWAVTPNGTTVAAVNGEQAAVVLFDVSDPSKPAQIAEIPSTSSDESPSFHQSLTFNQDGSRLFVGAWSLIAGDAGDLWDVSDPHLPKPLATRFTNDSDVDEASFSPDGNTLVTTSAGGVPVVWDLTDPATATRVTTLQELVDFQAVHAMSFLPDSPVLITAGIGYTLGIDLADRTKPELIARAFQRDGAVTSLSVSADGRKVLTGALDGLMTVYDVVRTDRVDLRVHMTMTESDMLMAAVLSPDGKTITTTDATYTGKQWNAIPHGAPTLRSHLAEDDQQGLAQAYTADGTMLTVGRAGKVTAWNTAGSSAPVKVSTAVVHEEGFLHLAAMTPDGRFVATADYTGKVRVSDLTDPARPVLVSKFVDKEGSSQSGNNRFVISPDGRTLAFGRIGRTVKLWDVTPGREATPLGVVAGAQMPLAFSPDGRTFAAKDTAEAGSAVSTVSLWTMAGPSGPTRLGLLAKSHHLSAASAITFSPDGRTVALGGTNSAGLWDVSSPGRPRQTGKFIDFGKVQSFAFSRDRRTVVSLAPDMQATLWDLTERADPARVGTTILYPHSTITVGAQLQAVFSPDGRTLTSGAHVGGNLGSVAVWDLTDLVELRADPTRHACAIAGRGLTEDEWTRWISELPYQPTC